MPNTVNEQDLDKYDPSSNFYNSECNKETIEDEVDMPLYVKKNNYNNNYMSLCEKHCTFDGLTSDKTKIIYICYIKSNMTYNIENLNKMIY